MDEIKKTWRVGSYQHGATPDDIGTLALAIKEASAGGVVLALPPGTQITAWTWDEHGKATATVLGEGTRKDAIRPAPLTADEVRERCELDPWDVHEADIAAMAKQFDPPILPGTRIGRTSRMLCDAVAAVTRGERVAIFAASKADADEIRSRAKHAATACDADPSMLSVYHQAQRIESDVLVFVDHAVLQPAPTAAPTTPAGVDKPPVLTAEDVRAKVGLLPWDEFAAGQRRHHDSRTGATTRMLCEAVAAASAGKVVEVVVYTRLEAAKMRGRIYDFARVCDVPPEQLYVRAAPDEPQVAPDLQFIDPGADGPEALTGEQAREAKTFFDEAVGFTPPARADKAGT